MWRDLHAAIFGSSAQNTPAAKKPRAATATVFDTAGFAAFQAAVKNAAVTPVPFDSDAPASVTAPDLSGPPAPWRTRDDAHKGPHGFVAVVGESHAQ